MNISIYVESTRVLKRKRDYQVSKQKIAKKYVKANGVKLSLADN